MRDSLFRTANGIVAAAGFVALLVLFDTGGLGSAVASVQTAGAWGFLMAAAAMFVGLQAFLAGIRRDAGDDAPVRIRSGR